MGSVNEPQLKYRFPKELEMFQKNGGIVTIQDGNVFGEGGKFIGPKPDLSTVNFGSDTIVKDIKEASKKLKKQPEAEFAHEVEESSGNKLENYEEEESRKAKPVSISSMKESIPAITPPPLVIGAKKKKSKVEVSDASTE